MKLINRRVLIAGGSHGIGRAVAVELARRGNDVCISARNKEALEEIRSEIMSLGRKCETYVADATDKSESKRVVEAAARAMGEIDVALLNVGGAKALKLHKATVEDITQTMNVNYDTLIHYFVPLVEQMKKQKEGGIIANTNSLAGLQGLPRSSHYSASKAAARIFLDAARIELKEHNIRTVTVCPGFVATRAHEKSKVPTPFIISPEKAARKIVKAIASERPVKTFPWQLAAATYVGLKMPRWLSDFVLRKSMPG